MPITHELPLLVLLPGLDGTGLMFEPLLPFLEGLEPLVLRYPAELTSYAECLAFARAPSRVRWRYISIARAASGQVRV